MVILLSILSLFLYVRVLCLPLVDGVRAVGKPAIIFSILKNGARTSGRSPWGGSRTVKKQASAFPHASY